METLPKTGDLKAQLAAEILESENKAVADPHFYSGKDWWQLSEAEEQVFEFDRQRFSRMMMTWHCCEVCKLISDATTWDDATIEQAHRDYPQWARPTDQAQRLNVPSFREIQLFAEELGGLTYREFWCMWSKNEAWTLRLGVIVFADEQDERDQA